ncbi:MAG: hypothetical protein IH984_00135 [Planctomycetes bacterium]|nr:hypothetical protein [Planctomycetota bacterium]
MTKKRVILLGASNLARAISPTVATCQCFMGCPLEIYIAMGHGRSFGKDSRVLGRGLPSINDCGLWDEIAKAQPLPTYALITDVGNDIAYGYEVKDIKQWVESCIKKLSELSANIVLTRMPVERIARLSKRHYKIAKAILFPGHELTYEDAQSRLLEMDGILQELGKKHGAAMADLPGSWYGIDPVHIKRSLHKEAFAEILKVWSDSKMAEVNISSSLSRWVKLRIPRPHKWSFLGLERSNRQPAARLADGSRVWLY